METYKRLEGYIHDFCFSKSKIARKINKNPSWMTNILSGKTNLRVEDFNKICWAIGTDWETILNYEPKELSEDED